MSKHHSRADADPSAEPDGTSARSENRGASWGAALGALAFPLFMAVALPGVYLAGMHQPAPDDVKVEIIATSPATTPATAEEGAAARAPSAAELAMGIGIQSDGRIDAATVPDLATAKAHLKDLTSRAAYDASTGELYVASAGSPAAAHVVETVFEQVAKETGATLSVTDLAPLPENDRIGISFMFLGIAGVLAGFTGATVVELIVAGMALRRQLVLVTGVSLASGVVASFFGYSVYGALTTDLVPVAGLVSLIALVSGLVQLGGLKLLGPAMTLPSIVLLIILGIPSSGAAVPVDLMPDLFAGLQHVLSTSAGLDALRRVLYFDGAGVSRDLPALVLWGLIGAGMLALATLKSKGEAADPLLAVEMPADPDERSLKRRRLVAGGLLLPTFFMVVMPALFLGIFHSPSPHEMKVAVIGSASATAETRERLATALGDKVELSSLPTARAAQDALREQEVRAAFNPATGDIYIASAGGKQSAVVAEQILTDVVASAGGTATVHDVVSLPEKDPVGASLMYAGIGAIVGGFLAAIVLSLLGRGLPLFAVAGLVTATALVSAGIETAYLWWAFDIVDGNVLAGFGVLALLSLVAGMVTLAGFKLIGPAQIMVSLLLLAFCGVAGSGVGVQLDLGPAFYTFIHDVLPTPSALSALRSVIYFDGNGVERDLAVVLIWLGGAILALPFAAWLRSRGRGPDDNGLDDEVLGDLEADEAIGAAAAAAAAAL